MLKIGRLPPAIGYVFLGVGIVFCASVAALLVMSIFEWIRNIVNNIKWQHQYKHRFDKAPEAKCYCHDCEYFGKNWGCEDINACVTHKGWRVADNWFCWSASPCNKDPSLKDVKK